MLTSKSQPFIRPHCEDSNFSPILKITGLSYLALQNYKVISEKEQVLPRNHWFFKGELIDGIWNILSIGVFGMCSVKFLHDENEFLAAFDIDNVSDLAKDFRAQINVRIIDA